MKQGVHFANVDLELECGSDLQPLIGDLGPDISVQYHDRLENGNDFASLAIRSDKVQSGVYGDADKTISAFCDVIERISPEAKTIWDRCVKRELDVGFESGNTGKTFEGRLETLTLRRVVEIGATIEITIYPVPKD
ncbi:MAG: hypothetical protein ABI999_08195 [Acidobacteriota bacterium]